MSMKLCPCGSQVRYLDCCGRYIQKKLPAPTPLALMRSRYSAFVEGNIGYIRKTMRGEAILNFDKRAAKEEIEWLSLDILNFSKELENQQIGYVEFIAKYKKDSNIFSIHEKSTFHLMNGKWYYVLGDFISS